MLDRGVRPKDRNLLVPVDVPATLGVLLIVVAIYCKLPIFHCFCYGKNFSLFLRGDFLL